MKDKKFLNIMQLSVGIIVLITFFLPAIDARIITTSLTNSFSGSDLSFGYVSNGYKMTEFNFFILVLYFLPAISGILLTYLDEKVNYMKYISIGLNVLALVGFVLIMPVLFQPIGGFVYIGGPVQSSNYSLTPGFGLVGAIVFSVFAVGINLLNVFHNKIFKSNE